MFQSVEFSLDMSLNVTDITPSLDYLYDATSNHSDQGQCWNQFKKLVEDRFSILCHSYPEECAKWNSPMELIVQKEHEQSICHDLKGSATPFETYWIEGLTRLRDTISPKTETLEPECADLELNETRAVRLNRQSSPTGVPSNYNVTKIGDKQFEIVLNAAYNIDISDKFKSKNEFYNFANACLKSFDHQLHTSSGEKISLRLPVKSEYEKLKDITHIRVLGEESRSHSLEYSKEIDCSTILHETLHLLGLVDEYQEHTMGYASVDGNNWIYYPNLKKRNPNETYFHYLNNCRIPNENLSLMASQRDALGKSLYRRVEFKAKRCTF